MHSCRSVSKHGSCSQLGETGYSGDGDGDSGDGDGDGDGDSQEAPQHDLPFNARQWAENPSGRETPTWERNAKCPCKTQTSALTIKDQTTCTACPKDYIFVPYYSKFKAGWCVPWKSAKNDKSPPVFCQKLDHTMEAPGSRHELRDRTMAAVGVQNVICTKYLTQVSTLQLGNLDKSSQVYKWFEPISTQPCRRKHRNDYIWKHRCRKGTILRQGRIRSVMVRCNVVKYTACRGQKCAVKKLVQCKDVCPKWSMSHTWAVRLTLKRPHHCQPKYCKNFGAVACQQVAMMA